MACSALTCCFAGRGERICTLIWARKWAHVPVRAHGEMASGATAVHVVYSSRQGLRDFEHTGSAHDEPELEVGGW
jgi:hypothetical protein